MAAGANLDWLYHTLGWVIGGAAVTLLAWALFWDRARGRKRCPKCWYDMAGVPGLRCPECGCDAKREKRLTRTRRRKWWAGFAVVSMVVGFVVHRVPEVAAHGWRGSVPTTVLILALPWLPSPEPDLFVPMEPSLYSELVAERLHQPSMWNWQRRWLVSYMIRGDRQRPDRSESWRGSFGRALSSLLNAADTDEGQWRPPRDQPPLPLADHDVERIRAALIRACIHTRTRWPENSTLMATCDAQGLASWDSRELFVTAEIDHAPTLRAFAKGWNTHIDYGRSFSQVWYDDLKVAGVTVAPRTGVVFNAEMRNVSYDQHKGDLLFHGRILIPITIGGTVDDVISPCRSPAIEQSLHDHMRPTAFRETPKASTDRAPALTLNLGKQWHATMAELCTSPTRLTFGIRIELMREGRSVGKGRAWWSPSGKADSLKLLPALCAIELDVLDETQLAAPDTGSWTVKLTGDGEISLRDFESDHYWKGEVVLPVLWSPRATAVDLPGMELFNKPLER